MSEIKVRKYWKSHH